MCYVRDENWNIIGERPGMGEFSVAWNQYLNKWIMLYNHCNPPGINFRVADYPWGPWSENAVLFNRDRDNGSCCFIHKSWKEKQCDYVYDDAWCDTDHDPNTPLVHRTDVSGAEYGPFIINRYTKGVQDQWTTIYFVMSTWNPYQKVLMKTTLSTSLEGDVYPPATCGDGVIDIYDILTEVDFILGIQIPTACQDEKGDVPNGMPPYYCMISDGVIDIFDAVVMIDAALWKPNCFGYCLEHDCGVNPYIFLGGISINGKSVTIGGKTIPSSGATITRIHWHWGDGTSGDQWFPASHTYSTSGTYTVTATAYDSAGKSASADLTVTTK
jgi:hypothetical protein